jgi:hypothetical protein
MCLSENLKRKKMSSVIQKYKKLTSRLEELRFEKMHLHVDLDLHISSRKNYRLWYSQISTQIHNGQESNGGRREELAKMIVNKGAAIAQQIELIQKNKTQIKSVKKKMSMLVG